MTEHRTTCPYCGVGCGVVIRADGSVAGDPAHPANRGRLCSKGAALAETLDDRTRLTTPLVGGEPASWDAALDLVAARFRAAIADHGPDSVAFYLSGQLLTEDYYVANKLMKGFIGSANLDTNSRLCMASSVAGHIRAFGEDVVPGVYEDFEDADLVVLVGSNLAWCHPVLHQRLLAARAAHGTKIVVLDPRRTATAEGADLHIPLAPETDVALFDGLLAYLAAHGAVDQGWVERHTTGLEQALAAAAATTAPATTTGPRAMAGEASRVMAGGGSRVMAGGGRPSTPFAATGGEAVDGRPSPAMTERARPSPAITEGARPLPAMTEGARPLPAMTEGARPLPAMADDTACLDTTAAICGVDPEVLETFYAWFAGTERVLTVYSQGVNQSAQGTDKVNAIINCHLATGRIGRPGMGPFSVTGQPNAMGGREVGGLANQLAAHMGFDDPDDRAALAAFWGVPRLPPRPGLKAIELFEAVRDGRIKALWIAATNPADSLPRAGLVREALAACPFVVVADCWPTDTTDLAHVVLPAAGWSEKDGTVTNSERRLSRQRAFRAPPGEARPDWWMLAELGRRLGWPHAFAWSGPAAIFREHAALSGHANRGRRVFDISALADRDDADYDAFAPVRWPLPSGAASEGGRLFAQGSFPTPDGRARFVPTPWRGAAVDDADDRSGTDQSTPGIGAAERSETDRDSKDLGRPVLLNTGRVRDQWHTMTRTGSVPRLMSHTSEPRLALHPADATALGLAEGDLAAIETVSGRVLLRTERRHAQRRGDAFAPMHWTDRFTSSGPIGQTIHALTDPISGQPALKSTRARITRVAVHLHGLLLRRSPGPLGDAFHWTRTPIEEGQLYRLELLQPAPTNEALRRLAVGLLATDEAADWLEMADTRRGVFRIAALHDGAVEAAVFLARSRDALPDAAAVIPMLGAPVPDSARPRLLAGRLYDRAAAEGPRVCACFGVSRDAIRHAIVTHGLPDAAAIGRLLRAGTNCGSCIPELEEILRDVRIPAA
ncbi:MAG: molybdopterin-dependent oxidoreductase [Rhodospirillales bacterium]|nr:molybdopterin-dependent oxidoreductase [Rhodospirillales bacterium]